MAPCPPLSTADRESGYLSLEHIFPSSAHPKMWPSIADSEYDRAVGMTRRARSFWSRCSLLFWPSKGVSSRAHFEGGLDLVDQEFTVTLVRVFYRIFQSWI
ncbi:hypothetical protein EON65_33095 [archaeon]|nr:MAG: hypothetical protein EON65_33095 [archaeon]